MGLIGVLHCGKCHRSDVELEAVKSVPMIKYDWLPGQCLPPEAENDLYCKNNPRHPHMYTLYDCHYLISCQFIYVLVLVAEGRWHFLYTRATKNSFFCYGHILITYNECCQVCT